VENLNVTADEMIDELSSRCTQLQIELAASRVLIRKLQKVVDGQTHSQEEEQSLNGQLRPSVEEGVSH
jgi:hypothetical protein